MTTSPVTPARLAARQVLGSPSVEGEHEAVELRGCGAACSGRVTGEIAQRLVGSTRDPLAGLDRALRELDGTGDDSRLGVTTIVAVSIDAAGGCGALRHRPDRTGR